MVSRLRRPCLVATVGVVSFVAFVVVSMCREVRAFASVSDCRYSSPGVSSVTDYDTGLVWQTGTNSQGVNALQAAEQYCASIESSGAAWRLPTIHELHTIVDESQSAPKIDPTRFTMPSAPMRFWSSTPVAGEANQMWGVDFSTGFTVKLTASPGDAGASTPAYVRCVR